MNTANIPLSATREPRDYRSLSINPVLQIVSPLWQETLDKDKCVKYVGFGLIKLMV